MTRAWFREVAIATTRGRCLGYVGSATLARRPDPICRRQGHLTLTVGNRLPTGPFCRQHGLQQQDRELAHLVDIGRSDIPIKLEEIPR